MKAGLEKGMKKEKSGSCTGATARPKVGIRGGKEQEWQTEYGGNSGLRGGGRTNTVVKHNKFAAVGEAMTEKHLRRLW